MLIKFQLQLGLKHKPTGIVVTAHSERYQGKNREYALKILKSKTLAFKGRREKTKGSKFKGRI